MANENIFAYNSDLKFKSRQFIFYSNFSKKDFEIINDKIVSKDFIFSNKYILGDLPISLSQDKYLDLSKGIGEEFSRINAELIDNMPFDRKMCENALNKAKYDYLNADKDYKKKAFFVIIEHYERYLNQRKDDSFYKYLPGNCFDSTLKLGEIIEEKINNKGREFYWIQLLLKAKQNYEHFALLAFSKDLEWVLLDGKRNLPEGTQKPAICPEDIKKTYLPIYYN